MNELDLHTAPPWMKATAIAIVGHRGSGKTALAYSLLDSVKDRPVWCYQHPKPELLAERGWRQMHRLEQMEDIDNAVVSLDEPQISIQKLDKRANDGLQRLLSVARHRDLTLVISTCDTRWITRALESYIDVWCCLDVNPMLVKQGSLIKKIISKYVVVDIEGFRLQRGEFLLFGRDYENLDGKTKFSKPEWFDDRWSKPYALVRESATETATPMVLSRNGS